MTKRLMSRLTVIKSLLGCSLGLAFCFTGDALAGDFQLRDLQSRTHRLSDHKGGWVLVNFWATWCSPCLSEIPELNTLHETFPNLIVIGVAMQSGAEAVVRDFAESHHMHYHLVMGTRDIAKQVISAAGQDGTLEVLPVSFLFGPQGELVYDKVGVIDAKSISRLIKPLSLPR